MSIQKLKTADHLPLGTRLPPDQNRFMFRDDAHCFSEAQRGRSSCLTPAVYRPARLFHAVPRTITAPNNRCFRFHDQLRHARLNETPPKKAESGSCTTAGVTRARLAAVPGGAARHSCIVNALADFRRLVSQQDREGGDGHDEEVAGDGNGKPVAADTGEGQDDKTPTTSTGPQHSFGNRCC